MTKSITFCALATLVLVAFSSTTFAAKKPKGVQCEHFSQSVFIPISRFGKANRLRVGQVTYITVAGGGRVKCRVV